jgi:hypothetical protein
MNIPFLSNNKKIEFVNEIEGVAQLMPLIPARQVMRPWVDKARADFAEIRKNPDWRNSKTIHTARCPGIYALQRHGWVLRTWQDIEITTHGDGVDFLWRTPSQIGGDAVGFHPPHQLADYHSDWPKDTLRTLIKIHTGWRCIVPDGYYLLEMPVPMVEENRFTTVSGYFSKDTGPAHMNVQLMWHIMSGSTLIKAGTPIAQYVLVPKDQPEMVCRDAEKRDGLRLSHLYDSSKFVKNFSDVKRLFSGKE